MRLTICIALAALSLSAAPSTAQTSTAGVTVHRGSDAQRQDADARYAEDGAYGYSEPAPGRIALRGGDVAFGDDGGLNAFFYPNGYDPQYGSEGRLPDAADFAENYGCAPIWNGKYGYYAPACN